MALTLLLLLSILPLTAVTGIPTKEGSSRLDEQDWWQVGQDELLSVLQSGLYVAKAKNVIFFLGDGLGVSTVTAARWLQAQQRGKNVKELLLSFEHFPHTAISRTYNVDVKTADSAAAATAFLSGVKARSNTLGVTQDVVRNDCSTFSDNPERAAKSILHESHAEGKWTGIVTTTRLTHATPAAAYAASPERDWEDDGDLPPEAKGKCKDIASQLVDDNDFIRVILGGGREKFLPNNTKDPERGTDGTREDGRNLLEEWKTKLEKRSSVDKVKLVMNKTDFDAVDANQVEYLMGMFETSHMQYEVDREDPEIENWGEPSLTEMTEKAINILKRSTEGFFLLVEGGRIDHAHHDNNAYRALTDTIAFSDAIQKATEMTDDSETLIVVTADHSHVFTMGGYPSIDTDIMGITDDVDVSGVKDITAEDDLPYLILSYADGPGFYYHRTYNNSVDDLRLERKNLTEDAQLKRTADKEYLQAANVPKNSETHGGEDVVIYARGPMSHLFHGSHEQNYIAHVMMYASCVGPNKDHCDKPRYYPGCKDPSNSAPAKHQLSSVFASLLTLLCYKYLTPSS